LKKFPVLLFTQQGKGLSGMDSPTKNFHECNTTMLIESERNHGGHCLPPEAHVHAAAARLQTVKRYYPKANIFTIPRVTIPHRHLKQVTETI